ncbi:MAG: type II secretion system F family protein [Bacillota bacterium]|nr:type II secretion system F family protein [Bacillota bacterium]
MLYISVFLFFLSVFLLMYGMLSILNRNTIKMEQRLDSLKGINTEGYDESRSRSFHERAVAPLFKAITDTLLKVTPKNKIAGFSRRLERAGLLKNSTMEKWLYTKSMLVVFFPLFFGVLVYLVEPSFFKAGAFVLIIILLVNTVFNFFISGRIEARKKQILKDLPYTLDLITVSVEAGLSFDGAMARVVSNINGELCDEFSKALKEIRMGIQRKTALRNMGDRCDVRELSMLVTSLIQADDLGVSLGRVLRIESSNLREHRKQVAREKAMKAPIKLLFPLIFFIFPSIFIVILGPAVIKIFTIL